MSSIISLATPDLSFLQLRIARPTPCNLVNMRHGTKDVDLLLVCHSITCILDICTDVRENDGYIRPPLSKKSFPVSRVGKKKPVGRSGISPPPILIFL